MNSGKIKTLITVALAAGTAIWGWYGWMVIIWIATMILDYITGSAAAARAHEWSSSRARDGLWHKAGMIVAVIVSVLGDMLIGLLLNSGVVALPFTYSVLISPLVTAWYIVTELGSIIENAAALGARIPSWLARYLKITAEAIDNAGQEAAGPENENDTKGEDTQGPPEK